jgi:beta-galactosidase
VPRNWEDSRLLLHFEAVAGECQVWVNGRRAGGHFDSWLPFDLDVTSLVRWSGPNELLVGVRALSLFEKRSARYPKMRAPFPCGSSTERLAGIWGDVYLLGVPTVRVRDVFAKPRVGRDTLELNVTVANDTGRAQRVDVDAEVRPWVNLAPKDAPAMPRYRLGGRVLGLAPGRVTVPARGEAVLTLRAPVRGRLKPWSPGAPDLYAALVSLSLQDPREAGGGPRPASVSLATGGGRQGRRVDLRLERFGWREFRLRGRELLLNGRPLQLTGDLLHPFGPFVLSRSYAWAWYRAIQGFGGNAVRLHGQVHPRHYLELADEMGLVVLDETSLFGSSVALNFEEPVAWRRFEAHYDGLVLRDRNHPSVLGWSFGNELFAIFDLNEVTKEDADRWYAQLARLGLRARKLDDTRDWISCDGDEDLRGTLPVWSKHFGHGTPLDRLPSIDKPLMVGESGGSYYARPGQLAQFNGERAYESYAGRNEALGIDLYDNVTRMAGPRLAYFSASETCWFGLEHLPLGYRDFSRLPTEADGVFLTRPYREGQPGIQPERIPPYVCTLNPGWDAAVPLYKPLAMYEAEKAALARPGPLPWKPSAPPMAAPTASAPPILDRAAFVGDLGAELGRQLTALGAPLGEPAAKGSELTVVDAESLNGAQTALARQSLERVRAQGGTLVLMVGPGDASRAALEALLPGQVVLTERAATALVPDRAHPWAAGLTLPDLYFAEDGANRFILRAGLGGPLVERGRAVLRASDTDWSLFNNAPEEAKCGAVVLYEHLLKPSGAALVAVPWGKGTLGLCSLDYRVRTKSADALWRKLLANLGLKLREPERTFEPALEGDTLVKALSVGRFGAANLDAALATDFVGEATVQPARGSRSGGLVWEAVACPSRDRFMLNELGQEGPQEAFATYFSFRIHSPRALDDLLAGGPDAPRFGLHCYVADRVRLFLNGREMTPGQPQQADYRSLYTFDALPLKRGWNHLLLKVASQHLSGETPGTLAVRAFSSSDAFLRELDSAVAED